MLVQQSGSPSVRHDVTVVIRSAGERTTNLTHQLLGLQVPTDNILVIREYPFTRALRKSFELGIELDRPWTLCVDADTLLRRNSIEILVDWARTADRKTFQIQGNLFDKMFGGSRKAGHHLYRTSLLSEALDCIPVDGGSLRPESSAIKQMASRGFPSARKNLTIGLHDFEQYYRDIYRKAFVHAHKHAAYIRHLDLLWRRLASQDPDYRVALWGLRAGRLSHGIVSLDARCFPQDLSSLLDRRGLREKKELAPQEVATWDVERAITLCYRARILAKLSSSARTHSPAASVRGV
jgi:hypothetical protein